MYTKEESMYRMFVSVTQEFMILCDRFKRIHEMVVLYDQYKGTMDPFLYEKCYDMFSTAIEAMEEQIVGFYNILVRLQAYLSSIEP